MQFYKNPSNWSDLPLLYRSNSHFPMVKYTKLEVQKRAWRGLFKLKNIILYFFPCHLTKCCEYRILLGAYLPSYTLVFSGT